MMPTDATRTSEHGTELPRIRSDPDSVRRASRFLTDIPARNQVLMFPEIWDLPEGDGHVFCLDDEWRVLAVSVLEPGKCFVPARGSWYPGWTYYFSSGDDLLRRCANIYLLLPASGRAVLLPRQQVREAIARGLKGGMADTTRPTVLPDPPPPWQVSSRPIAYTVAILLDEPLTFPLDFEYEDYRLVFRSTHHGAYTNSWPWEKIQSERRFVEILLEST
jgi:hypothetical protein